MADVICPADKGTLAMEACLACSQTWANPCMYDYGTLKAMFDKPDRSGIHVTDLTSCLRKAYFDKTRPQPKQVHDMLVLFAGTAVHAGLENGGDDLSHSEMPLHHNDILGTADRVYKDGILVDYKTTRWLKPSQVPHENHILQVQIYAHILEQMGQPVERAYIQYIDLTGPTRCQKGSKWAKCNTLVVLRDGMYVCPKCGQDYPDGHLGSYRAEVNISKDIERIVTRLKDALQHALDTGEPPYPSPGWLCNYCDHVEVCDAAKGGPRA